MNIKTKYKILFSIIIKWVLLGGLIGIAVGTTTALLLTTNDFLGEVRDNNGWIILFLPLAGLLIGFMYMQYGIHISNKKGEHLPFPNATPSYDMTENDNKQTPDPNIVLPNPVPPTVHDSATGNNLVIEGILGKKNVLRRMGPIVYLGTFLTVLFGGSTGREGAAIQMGGSVATAVNHFFKTEVINKKIMLMSGVSAGFGAAFGTPITGAIFGMEIASQGKLKFEALIPCLVASFVGHYITEAAWGVEHEQFVIQTVPEHSIMAFVKVIALAVLFGLLSIAYCQLRHGIQKYSETYFNKNHMKRAFVGGIIIVLLTVIVGSQDYNGRGLDMLEESFSEEVPPFAFLAKLVFTAVTLGFGFVGGEAIPLFFMGATLGNALYPMMDMPLSFLAALGMIAAFCGGANTPIAAFLLALEMFEGKGVEYFFIACLVSYIVSGHHGLWPAQTIYEPKSRLYSFADAETIEHIEKKKKL